MNIKTNLLEDYVKFGDNTKQQNTYYKTIIFLFVRIISLFSNFILFICINE